jgi:hypothetical protein
VALAFLCAPALNSADLFPDAIALLTTPLWNGILSPLTPSLHFYNPAISHLAAEFFFVKYSFIDKNIDKNFIKLPIFNKYCIILL